jgi:hypothetical protein
MVITALATAAGCRHADRLPPSRARRGNQDRGLPHPPVQPFEQIGRRQRAGALWKISNAQIICIQVVPLLDLLDTTQPESTGNG